MLLYASQNGITCGDNASLPIPFLRQDPGQNIHEVHRSLMIFLLLCVSITGNCTQIIITLSPLPRSKNGFNMVDIMRPKI